MALLFFQKTIFTPLYGLNYIPPYTNQTFTVFYMDKFPKADLVVEGLKCDGQTFIKKPTKIDT